MDRKDWRSSPAYITTFELDRSGFSWELLRRSPDYQRDFRADVSDTIACGEAGRFPAAWGLRFHGRPGGLRPGSADLLD